MSEPPDLGRRLLQRKEGNAAVSPEAAGEYPLQLLVHADGDGSRCPHP